MTDPEMLEGEGERAFRRNRKRFWRLVWRGLAIGMVLGAAGGFLAGFARGWADAGGQSFTWIVWPMLAVALWAFYSFTRQYFARIDELDMQDNLWASLIGFYVYLMLLPCWALLHELGQMPAPDHWIIWIATFLSGCVAYGWRKFRP